MGISRSASSRPMDCLPVSKASKWREIATCLSILGTERPWHKPDSKRQRKRQWQCQPKPKPTSKHQPRGQLVAVDIFTGGGKGWPDPILPSVKPSKCPLPESKSKQKHKPQPRYVFGFEGDPHALCGRMFF